MTSEWRGITTSVLSSGMTTGPSHLCHPLLELNLCRRFNAGTKLPEPTLGLIGPTLLVPTTSTWEGVDLLDSWTTKYKFPINPVAGTCTSSGTQSSSLQWLLNKQDCKALKMSSKEIMNRRQFQAKLASSLILVNTTFQTPKRGRPSSGKGSPTVTSGSPLTPQKRLSKRCAQLPLGVHKDLTAHFPVETGRGCCRRCINVAQCSKCDVRLCFSEDKNCLGGFHNE